MSTLLRVPIRERWAAKSMIVRRWLTDRVFTQGQAICELEIDGELTTFTENKLHPGEQGAIYWYFVKEGAEVGPSPGSWNLATQVGWATTDFTKAPRARSGG